MNLPDFEPLIRAMVANLCAGHLDAIPKRDPSRPKNLIQREIDGYPYQIIPLPPGRLDLTFGPGASQSEWLLDIPLWTREEGRSDLHLMALASYGPKKTPTLLLDQLTVR